MSQEAILILGKHLNVAEIIELLRKAYPTTKIDDSLTDSNADMIVKKIDYSKNSIEALTAELNEKRKEVDIMKQAHEKAIASIQSLNKQQKALYDEFVLLRQKYDQQKVALVNVLWTQCCEYHPDLRQIPRKIQDNEKSNFIETDYQVGDYIIGETLGEGQFALVKSCVKEGGDGREYALKIIQKERITSFTSLARVSTEIDNLKHLIQSKHIIKITDIMQTQTRLYIVTEKGGFDLFEFFDCHPDGVPEQWAKQIIVGVLKATLFCHDQGICHRDLKPENILVTFDVATEKCVDLKLCDFGLSTKFNPRVMLTDFCGSPGFFAPEMIIHGTYFGDKVDVWSIGCILLELILGHEKFCDVWMASYDYEILQDKASFTSSIEETLRRLPRALRFSSDLNDFILRLLQLKSSKRPTIRSIASHPWLEGLLDEDMAALRAAKMKSSVNTDSFSPQRATSPNTANGDAMTDRDQSSSASHSNRTFSGSPNALANGATGPDGEATDFRVDTEVLKKAFQNLSEKERKQMEEYILRHRADSQEHAVQHLPPIEPPTPNIGQARKLLSNRPFFTNGESSSQPPTPMKTNSNFILSPLPRGMNGSSSRSYLPGLLENDGASSKHLHDPLANGSSSTHSGRGGADDDGEVYEGLLPATTRSLNADDDRVLSPLVSSKSHSSLKIT